MLMTSFLAAGASSPGVYYAYQNSDSVGKGIVIFLLVGSVLTWTVMLDKVMALCRAKRLSERFLFRFRDNRRNVATPSLVRDGAGDPAPVAVVYTAGVEKLLEFYENGQDTNIISTSGGIAPVKLSDHDLVFRPFAEGPPRGAAGRGCPAPAASVSPPPCTPSPSCT